MNRRIAGFHKDEEDHWVADLDCGHRQHVRHDPPMVERPWVLTPDGRQSRLGVELDCKRCDEAAAVIALALQKEFLDAVAFTEMDAAQAGMCADGQEELLRDRLKSIDAVAIAKAALEKLS